MSAERPYAPRVVKQAIDLGGRTPPHDVYTEQAVISAILLDARKIDACVTILPDGEPFFVDANRRIYDVAVELHTLGQMVDIQTVANVLKVRDRLQAVGGLVYMSQIINASPAIAHVEAHARIVREYWRVRQTIETCQMTAAAGYGDYGDAQAYIDGHAERIYAIARHDERKPMVMLYDVVRAELEAYGTGIVPGLPTGFVDVDTQTGGMHDGELILAAGRPGQGKSAYVMNVARNVAAANHGDVVRGVMVFELEMPSSQLGQRMVCSEGRANLADFRKRTVPLATYDRMVVAADELAQLPVWLNDTPALSLAELRALVRRQQYEFNKAARVVDGVALLAQRVSLVVVDYLQLMRGEGKTREEQVSSISRGLKQLAKELGLPVLACAQLNRAVETRSTKEHRPQLSDLRESGSLEMDADVVQFLYRPETYLADKHGPEAQKYKGYAEVIVAKQRNGPTGIVPVTFVDQYTRFENRDRNAFRPGDDR